MSEGGNATFSGSVTADERVIVTGNTNNYSTAPLIYFDSTSTANAGVRDWAIGPADDDYGNFHIFVGASTGADPVGNAGRVVTITNSGNVGIGTASPANYTYGDLVIDGVTGSGNASGITLVSTSASYGGIFFADGTTGDERYRGYLQYNHNYSGLTDTFILGTSGATRVTVDENGNVGIGASPSGVYKLQVNGGISLSAKSLIDNSAYFISGTNGFRWNNSTDAYNNCIMYDNGNMYVRGNLGIGESSPGATLHVKGSSGNIYGRVERASASQGEVGLWVRGGTAADYNWYIYQKNNDSALHFYNQQDRLTIDSSGKVGIGKSPSTWRLDVDSTDGYIASFDGNSNTGIAINSYSGASDIIGYSNSASSYNSVHIRGAGGTGLVVDTSNNVGIGTSAPYTKLQVEGTVSDTYTPTAFLDKQQVRIRHPNAANNYGGIGFTNSAGNYEWFIGSNQTSVSPAIADFVIQGADSTSGYTENMRIDCGGHVTMPRQPYVQGRGNGGWSAFSASAIWEIQPHGSTPVTSLDRNSDYSTTNKRFTCPVDGVYLVCASWYIYQTAAASAGGQYLHPALYKNGNIAWNSSMQPYQIFGYEINRGGTGSKHYDGVQMTYTIYCSANDYLDIRCYTPNANTQSYENYHYFSYTLLS